ncbi:BRASSINOSTEROID INSENSITIVE 1-associated receptor kinase 1 [Striga hermonthica]|uniref:BRASSINOSTEROID INSENSITIVE 1-associated receptor kinase 1 n=1 Tax=Striga hermonthica TaxID=68872 RepID=A0A9N7N2C3_STRHE|nr:BRASSINOSTEROID INSENSITIVE 1-associated receptor kinase 1 [Striga hermonthica]
MRVIFMTTLWILIMRPQSVCPASIRDGNALIAFKNKLNDPRKVLKSWGVATDNYCTNNWHGIVCDHYEYVSAIVLNQEGLRGQLVPELASLTRLGTLNVGYNNLKGTIPYQLGHLPKLTYLILDHNQLSGWIPQQLGLGPNNLQYLYLQNNQLNGTVPVVALKYLHDHNHATINCKGNQGLCVPPDNNNMCC